MRRTVFIIISLAVAANAWSRPYYPGPRAPMRFTRFAPPPPQQHAIPIPVHESTEYQRPKRGHDDYGFDHDHDHDHDHGRDHDHHGHGSRGVTGPVHTFVKTDKNANYKWGVRHHVGNKFAS